LLTFDYELFHGRNFGPADEVLFEPTERILERCEVLGVAVTFFPDVCCTWWHREHGEGAVADRFDEQLRKVRRLGHDVQLHVHPHWLSCTRRGDRFELAPDRMYLHELGWGDGEAQAPAVLRRAVAYLNDLLRPDDPDYACVAFRAASLALQPEEGRLLATLQDVGIRLDTSIARGLYSVTDTYRIDYRNVPSQANWRMQPKTGLQAADSGILEVPIGTFRMRRRDRAAFLVRRLRAVGTGRGEPMARSGRSTLASLVHQARANLHYLRDDPWFSLSFDTKGYDVDMLVDGLERVVAAHRDADEIAVAVISHPKLMFAAQVELMAGFVAGARARFGERLSFDTTTATLAAFT
jgi:hypothetical protein